MHFRDDEIEITFFRSRGPGGQHKNVTESAVRVRHIPTGITAVATSSRSQHRNRQQALKELERRVAASRKRRKPRIRTRATAASEARRIAAKKRRGSVKHLRRASAEDSE
jgi:protein subunit release factor A